MSQNFNDIVQSTVNALTETGYSNKSVTEELRYGQEFGKYLLENHSDYAFSLVLEWLEKKKKHWSDDTYTRYRRAAYRTEYYRTTGEITDNSYHSGSSRFDYRDTAGVYGKLPEEWKMEFDRFQEYSRLNFAEYTVYHQNVPAAELMLYLSEKGCRAPETVTAGILSGFHERIRTAECSEAKKRKYREAFSRLMKYWYERGCLPSAFLYAGREKTLISAGFPYPVLSENKQHSTWELEGLAEHFFELLRARRYHPSVYRRHIHVLRQFFLFLEQNHLQYSEETAELWLNSLPKLPSWKEKQHILTWFSVYMRTGNLPDTIQSHFPMKIELLPEWSRTILYTYLDMLKKEGRTGSTLDMARSSCVRFLEYLHNRGITGFREITFQILHEFRVQDVHRTPQGKNAYSSRLRRFLRWLADQGELSQTLPEVYTRKAAPVQHIPAVLSEKMIRDIYTYRENAHSPRELRNSAIVLLGLRMGLRASDIVSLKLRDIHWQKKQISLVQQKTGKTIVLPIPNDTGNSLYRYLTEGRPVPGKNGEGYVFLQHQAPYGKLQSSVCRLALRQILAEYGHTLPEGIGFHITRKTFATELLRAGVTAGRIAEALGHSNHLSVQIYLSLDEHGMRQCPLRFVSVKKGECHE